MDHHTLFTRGPIWELLQLAGNPYSSVAMRMKEQELLERNPLRKHAMDFLGMKAPTNWVNKDDYAVLVTYSDGEEEWFL